MTRDLIIYLSYRHARQFDTSLHSKVVIIMEPRDVMSIILFICSLPIEVNLESKEGVIIDTFLQYFPFAIES